MYSFHLRRRLPETLKPKFSPANLHHIYHSIPSGSDIHLGLNRNSGVTKQDPEKIPKLLSNLTTIPQLNQVHAHIIYTGFLESNPAPFHWNNVFRAHIRLDSPVKALCIFTAMCKARVIPDSYTIPIVLKAVCQSFAINMGRQVHSVALKLGLESNEFCESGIISLYCKAGEFVNARKVFDENPERKLGSWNAIIGGFSHGGLVKEALYMFMGLKKCGFVPDDVTIVSVTSACGGLGDLQLALQLHKYVFQSKSVEKSDILMLNSLIDMYGKCGRMDLAYKVFWGMNEKNVSSWTSMIVGYATHGRVYEALEFFRSMREARVRPNHVTFIGVLSACVHGGKVQEGRRYLNMMKKVYALQPQLQHYGCMSDLLGRAGLFEEARKLVEEMPLKPNGMIWGCLLGACEKHGNVKMAEWVAKHLLELEPWNDVVYVVLSNIYASRGFWDEVERIRGFMKQRKLSKIPSYSLTT